MWMSRWSRRIARLMITPVTFMITVIRQPGYSLTDHRDQGARYSGGVGKQDPAGPDPADIVIGGACEPV